MAGDNEISETTRLSELNPSGTSVMRTKLLTISPVPTDRIIATDIWEITNDARNLFRSVPPATVPAPPPSRAKGSIRIIDSTGINPNISPVKTDITTEKTKTRPSTLASRSEEHTSELQSPMY